MPRDLGDWDPVLHLQHRTVTVLSPPASVIYNIVIFRHRHDELNVGAVKDASKPSGICWSQSVQHVLNLTPLSPMVTIPSTAWRVMGPSRRSGPAQ